MHILWCIAVQHNTNKSFSTKLLFSRNGRITDKQCWQELHQQHGYALWWLIDWHRITLQHREDISRAIQHHSGLVQCLVYAMDRWYVLVPSLFYATDQWYQYRVWAWSRVYSIWFTTKTASSYLISRLSFPLHTFLCLYSLDYNSNQQ